MCYSCWEELGKPIEDFPTKAQLIEVIHAVYEGHYAGGNLHCELDDWNLGDEYFEGPELQIAYDDGNDLEAERLCYALMKPLTEAQRAAALAAYEKFQ